MPEQILKLPEYEKVSQGFSQKTKKLIQAFSLSVGIILSGNAYSQNSSIETNIPFSSQELGTHHENHIHRELTYLFLEKKDGFTTAVIQKTKDEGIYQEGFSDALEYMENILIILFQKAIEKNGLELDYNLTPELIKLFESIKVPLSIFLELRYGKGKYDLFDGNNYSKYRIKIKFLETDNSYKIESLYITPPEEEIEKKSTQRKEIFFQSVG